MCHSEICRSNKSRGFIFVDKQHRGKKVENNETFFGDIFFCVEKKSLIKIYCQTTVQLVARCKSCFLSFSFSLSVRACGCVHDFVPACVCVRVSAHKYE